MAINKRSQRQHGSPQRRLMADVIECAHQVLWRWAGPDYHHALFFDVDLTQWIHAYRCASAPGALVGNITMRSLHTEIVFTNPNDPSCVRYGGLLAIHMGLSHDRRHIETALFFRSAHGLGETRVDYLYENHARRWPWMADAQKVARRAVREFRDAYGPAVVMLAVTDACLGRYLPKNQ
ncbi:hypothetical protein QKT49_gp276 [Acanthamoeba castellanii medusavirus]|uniref:Uncharacterized protein n=1 Tax=Acanthamoeba castellanii medusavirus J1 TaxID=3114988 RepID=A0A3T1CXB4_9VIRU|nr:hypothetical protein QKT49_gp276 [Acanthamoeba castellanii medusavirus]BBI30487.1 hypothetical protein [Acanthamoeba castellanii medusavirus J1]